MAQDGFGKRARLLFASAVGTIIEWYDFFVFATCAVLVFDKAFFPTADPAIGILLGLSTFAIGFIARPLGGIIFGVLGDRIGRKNALVVSLAMMGGSTFAMGLLPTYASVGVLAPALLVLLRIF
ncbi:MFS transporter, partial [Escherichia coli]|nr:MFS transporter [Escherichia coli]